MSAARHQTGFWLLLLAAVAGAALLWLPPQLIAYYRAASELEPWLRNAYLAAVVAGGVLLLCATLLLVVRVYRATRRKQRHAAQRVANPSRLTAAEQEEELRRNLSSGTDLTAESDVPEEVRRELRGRIEQIEARLEHERLEIVAFGTISSGKSSLLNALAGRELFQTDPVGGTTQQRNEIPWPGQDEVVLVDTPGLAEVRGEERAALAASAAKDADLVLVVVDGPLKAYEMDLLRQLGQMEKRLIVCLNKEDWYPEEDREALLAQIRRQVSELVAAEDVLAIRAGAATRRRVRVLADGSQAEEAVELEPEISPLAERMLAIVRNSRREMLLANLLLQSRGLVEQAKLRATETLDHRAEETIARYMWAAGGAAAVNPIPLLDIAGGSAITVKMVLDLARIYRQEIDADTVVQLLANLSKNLVAMLGVGAVSPAIASLLAASVKTVPGVGTVAGGLLQGITQALVTRWIGRVFMKYFRAGMTAPPQGLAELARSQWEEVTRPEQILKLVQAARTKLKQG